MYFSQSSVPTTFPTTGMPTIQQTVEQNTKTETQVNTNPAPQPAAPSNTSAIRITSPNGGEAFKIGSTVRVTWEAQNVPTGAQLQLELFEITSDKTIVSADGVCTNCTGGGLGSGVPLVQSVADGAGSAEWTAGKLPGGGSVSPGSRYIMKATLSKSGRASAGECPAGSFKGTCEVLYEVDWSDAAFSLTN